MNNEQQTLGQINTDIEIVSDLDLFAEDLPERLNTSGVGVAGKWSCLFCYACAGGSASCVSSFCTSGSETA